MLELLQGLNLSPDEIIDLKSKGFGDLMDILELESSASESIIEVKNENVLENNEEIFAGQKLKNYTRD